MSQSLLLIAQKADEFIESMTWSSATPDYDKTLVIGNIRGFAAFLDKEIGDRILDPVGLAVVSPVVLTPDHLITLLKPELVVEGELVDAVNVLLKRMVKDATPAFSPPPPKE